ncbi:MAG: hypothetical protein EA352_06680 [Gemmatimonadales bacterium]|nr:MAG: hypothetical protein EA352_06680 [Gemmatimonadales bacterium]
MSATFWTSGGSPVPPPSLPPCSGPLPWRSPSPWHAGEPMRPGSAWRSWASGIRWNGPGTGGGSKVNRRGTAPVPPPPVHDRGPMKFRMRRAYWWILSALVVVVGVGTWLAVREMRTSVLQARWIAPMASEISWWVEEGPSESMVPASEGPHDLRYGYAGLSRRVARAEERGFRIVHQARTSERFRSVVEDWGLFPIHDAKTRAGLTIQDRSGEFLFHHPYPERVYPTFEDIPPIVWQTLLFVENRTLLAPEYPHRNPAVEWGRLLRSTVDLGMRSVGRHQGNVAGASTLATQIEKFRHEPEGRTEGPRDKLLQMGTATFRAYRFGPETLEARRTVVRDYLNSVPLAAVRREGEVTGLGDGLWAWYGADFLEANRALWRIPATRVGAIPAPEELMDPAVLARRLEDAGISWEPVEEKQTDAALSVARTEEDPAPPSGLEPGGEAAAELDPAREYRRVLGLILAQRRPSFYLTTTGGREALARLTDVYVDLLEGAGVLDAEFAAAVREADAEPLILPPERAPVDFVERKAVNTVRTGLLGLLDVPRLYDLDRHDLTVRTTIDGAAQQAAVDLFRNLSDPIFIRERGFDAFRLLDRGDPALVIHSLVLHERTPLGNVVRVQADNLDAPFNLNESGRLELGSTAKLRTLVSYLEIVAELATEFRAMAPDSLRQHPVARQDRLSEWTRDRALRLPDEPLEETLRAAMNRSYSANPAERFVTGGGVQSFTNFDNTYDHRVVTVTEGFRHSINLVFVRLMRDVVNHYMYRVPGSTAHVLEERDSPLRQEYLERFADREGIQFLNQFIPKYRGRTRAEVVDALFQGRRLSPQRTAWAYRTAVPDGTEEEFGRVLRRSLPDNEFTEAGVADLWRRADPEPHNLSDLGYLASVHPLELWAARFFIEEPEATGADAIRASEEARQEVYRWLFRTSRTAAQDQRIRALLEVEAFTEVLRGWQRVGYPFENIVPSLGTSIGSSGDRPAALGELMGIILNDGVRLPTYRVEELHFAPGTPWETLMEREGLQGEQVMDPEVAAILREALVDVVEEGTARRMRGQVRGPDGEPLAIGGKTGTGDNRYRVFGSGGRLLESRSVNRTSTFVFFIGDRYYGVVSAYVPGEEAERYRFTSALPTQVLRELGTEIERLVAH